MLYKMEGYCDYFRFFCQFTLKVCLRVCESVGEDNLKTMSVETFAILETQYDNQRFQP